MSDINHVQLRGNVGKDPEFFTMGSGDELAKFSLATSRKWKDKNGDWAEDTSWHNIVVFNKYLVETVRDKVRKGSRVDLWGEVKTRSYEKDSQVRYVTEIVVPNFTGKLEVIPKAPKQGQQQQRTTSSVDDVPFNPDPDDDFPF